MPDLRRVLSRTRTITFDCYGTLIDWEAGVRGSLLQIFGPSAEARAGELFDAYVQAEARIEAGSYRRYRDVLAAATRELADQFRLTLPPGVPSLAERLPTWTPFADTNEALGRLKKRFRLGVLSNIDRDLFAATARHFSVPLDFVVTAEDVRSYKPGLAHFRRMMDLEGGVEGVLHVAQSQYHDGQAAAKLGLAFVWINRYNDARDAGVPMAAELADLRSLADAMDV